MDEFYHLRKVKYADRTAKGRAFGDLDGDDLLVTKASPWEYEAEWRMLAPLEDAARVLNNEGDTVYLFPVPTAAISRIVLGARSSEELRHRVERALTLPDREHIRVMQAAIDNIDQGILVPEPSASIAGAGDR